MRIVEWGTFDGVLQRVLQGAVGVLKDIIGICGYTIHFRT